MDPTLDRKLMQINLKLDKVLEILSANTPSSTAHNVDNIDLGMCFPLKEAEDLSILEEKLTDSDFKKNFISTMTRVNGKTGKSDGNKAAYELCDHLFDRNLLKQYNWTGKSKKDEESKGNFSAFTNIVETFGEIIMIADDRYTISQNLKFFKEKILKYAENRAKQKKVMIKKFQTL